MAKNARTPVRCVQTQTFKCRDRFQRLSGVLNLVLPVKVLERSVDKRISLLLKDSRILEGKLIGFDDYMNLVLEDTEETFEENVRRIGTVVLRGNNVISISPK